MPPKPSRFPRPNKRSTPTPSLAPLLNLYHHTPSFLPLATTSLPPHINHTFAPTPPRSADSFPTPSRSISLLEASKERTKEALKVDLKKSLDGVQIDGMKNFDVGKSSGMWDEVAYSSSTSSLWGKGSAEISDKIGTLKEGWKVSWQKGAEAPLRKRMRRALDVLHGTVAGGQPGELVVMEMEQSISELDSDLEAGKREREDAERAAEREAEEYARTFSSEEDDGLRDMINSRP